MTETLKKHASLRGVSNAHDEANQLRERRLAQSTSVTTLPGLAKQNRLGCRAGLSPLTVKSCDFSVRIWNRLSRLAMTQSVERTHGLNSHNALSPYQPNALSPCGHAFTMAEILLSLTIIGVVAAITLPSLMANINERTWNTQRKALYARMSQALSIMPQMGGYGTLTEDADGNVIEDTAAETFLTEGLSKVLKINNICDSEHLADCGIPTSYNDMLGNPKTLPTTLYELSSWFKRIEYSGCSYSTMDTKAAAFETSNGESIVAYYNQSCKYEYLSESSLTVHGNIFGFAQSSMCVNFIYDLNGNKGPNTVGKDMGIITSFNSNDPIVVAPMPSSTSNAGTSTWYDAASLCTAQNPESRIPNIDELSSMFINKSFINLTNSSPRFWSGSVYNAERALGIGASGDRGSALKTQECNVRCIKR